METQHIKVFGRVQGVGFRRATVKLAEKYDVTGTVANVEDFVEIFVTGHQEEVKRFAEKAIMGPAPFARVTSYTVDHIPLQEFSGFKQI